LNAVPGVARRDDAILVASGPLAAARAGGIQGMAALATVTLAAMAVAAGGRLASPWPWVLLHGLLAAILATAAGERGTRRLMHAAFLPAAVAGAASPVPAGVWLVAAVVLALTSHNALRERVPLFLSSAAARSRLLECLPGDRPVRFVDVGCGTGGVLVEVARERPTTQCLGLETAWLPWLIARARCGLSPNGARVMRRDLWQHPLRDVDVLYAYLSPVPMARLWAKACAEMAPGSVVVSNSFEIPGVPAESSLPVEDMTASVLHVYRVPPRGP
jgi:hypothetical protein